MDIEMELPQKRFKYQSLASQLKDVHLPTAFEQSKKDHDFEDSECQFYDALTHWRQLNLSPSFTGFADQVESLSGSLPLLLHHWREVVDIWISSTKGSDDEGLNPLLDLLQKLVIDLRGTLLPGYSDILHTLLTLLPKQLSAAVLTTLLASLSITFKHILVPTTDVDLVETTWTALRAAIAKSQPEVQRSVAEVWGSLLRRLKSATREKAATLAASDLVGIEDAVAWMFVSASKSVSQTLHTAVPGIITPVFDVYMSCDAAVFDVTYTLLRRVLTSLMHHVKNSAGFAPLSDILTPRFAALTAESAPDTVRRMAELLAITCSVRQGSRMADKQLVTVATTLPLLRLDETTSTALLKLSGAVLVSSSGGMALWMGAGRRYLENLWAMVGTNPVATKFVLELHGILVEANWGGWKMIALPALLKRAPSLLETQPLEALRLLAKVKDEGKLGEVDVMFKRGLEGWVKTYLAKEELYTAETVTVLTYVTKLSSCLSEEVTTTIIASINNILSSNMDIDDNNIQRDTLGLCLSYVSTRQRSEWSKQVDLQAWTVKVVGKWSDAANILESTLDLHQAAGNSHGLPFDEVYPHLRTAILSHDSLLRLQALKLLEASAGVPEAVKRCLSGEEVSLDVQGVRERTLKISRLTQGNTSNDIAVEICIRWLLAQLKVNLRPLWKPAASALAELAQGGHGDQVWEMIWAELQGTSLVKSSVSGGREKREEDEEDWEDERTWRDPSAHKMRVMVRDWQSDPLGSSSALTSHKVNSRFDGRTYVLGILDTLGHCPSLAEKHNRDLVPFMLAQRTQLVQQRQHFVAYLTLFAKFSNPKACFQTEQLHSMYLDLLAHPDRNLQVAALSCVLSYKTPAHANWADKLKALLDNTRWRDELTGLELYDAPPEVVQVVIRMLYGIMLERKGKSRRGNERRATILGILGSCSEADLKVLVQLMLRSLEGEGESDRQKVGFLTLLGDVMKSMSSRLLVYWPLLLDQTLRLLQGAQAKLEGSAVQDAEEEDEETEEADEGSGRGTKSTRVIRQLAIKRMIDFFLVPVDFDFEPYVKTAFEVAISPRVPLLDRENTQSPSTLLELFGTWSQSAVHAAYLVQYNADLLPKIYDCLIATNVKPPVVLKVFDIVENLLKIAAEEEHIIATVIRPHISHLLSNMAIMAERVKGTEDVLAQRQINVLSQIAQYASNPDEAKTLFDLFSPLLRKSFRVVSEKIKTDILKIMTHLIPLIPELADSTTDVYGRLHASFGSLLGSLRQRNARLALASAFQSLAVVNTSLQPIATLVEDWNAFSQKRVDEPDANRRISAYSTFQSKTCSSIPIMDWAIVLYQALHDVHDAEELAIRTSAGSVMKLFVDIVAAQPSRENEAIFARVLLPGVKNGLRSKNELVRAEVLVVLAHAVQNCQTISTMQDMRTLLADGDEEAGFFTNIHHVQIHRRSRALRRLADLCDERPMRSGTLTDYILPLVANYIVIPTSTNHHLVNDAILTTGRLAKHLAWGAYSAQVQRYMRLAKAKDEGERIYVRTLVAILDHFHFPMDESIEVEAQAEEGEEDDTQEVQPVAPATDARVSAAVNGRLLPDLLRFIESKDSTNEDTNRIPVAIGIVRIALHLPAETKGPQITRLLTILSQILRSKSQETRDLVRDTLVHTATTIGSTYLPIMIRELRAALLRGPHLHILAFTVHTILTHVTSEEHIAAFGNLDNCVGDIVHVSAEVIFGESGKDVQAEDFKTKLREVRASSSRGLDTFAIVAKNITPPYITAMLLPLRSILHETATSKILGLADEALKRVANGLNANKNLDATQVLSVCHSLITQNSKFLKEDVGRQKAKAGKAKDDAIVQVKRQAEVETNHYVNNSYRFVVLGLDLFQTALRRNRFDFHDNAILSRLESLLVPVGNTLYSSNGPVLIMTMKCLSALVKCPLRSWNKSLPVILRQTLEIIRQAGNTESELAQATLKSLAIILRDGPAADIREKDLTFLLELVAPDLEDTERQATVFTMLRAIVSRKFVVPEIYDLMEKVAEIMVTSQATQVQELCRGLLLQFLLDYPQGKGRLRNQMTFFAKNLSYVHERGRRSVMEIVGALISKFQSNLVQEYADMLFVSLVMVIANDESTKCVEIAAQLLKTLVKRLDSDRQTAILSHLHTWASQGQTPRLCQVAAQTYGLFIDALEVDCSEHLPRILEDTNGTLEKAAVELEAAENGEEDAMDVDLDWQSPYHSILVLSKVLKVFPDMIMNPDVVNWETICKLLLFPHAWVRTAASRLLGLLFSTSSVAAPEGESAVYPLSKDGMTDVAKKLALQLKSIQLDQALGLQIVKNLFFVGKCLSHVHSDGVVAEDEGDEEGDEGDEVEAEKKDDKASGHKPVAWLFSKLSHQARSAYIARRSRHVQPNWEQQPLAVFRWFAAMASFLPAPVVERFLIHILSPAYRFLEDDSIQDEKMDEIKTLATELQDLVQAKVGATAFSTVYNKIRQGVIGVRQERKTQRALQVATNPVLAAKRKEQKNTVKKESKKRKSAAFAENKGKFKRART
ncbi:hypothetical protein CYLTODRAFT_391770 [Cylindrobasidium torrendii FP15055 ss-10]|uniref:Uncharacterized protein n=1 Tax=Cylindrobasidium torrendii FP15055 ss-10 TaxID=1314674 RepID=A0A0D7BK91_9AGAR|nr:hypothetical protein CYLTODRAFT_391770 [Cylindrobasidium torrendii FP15055 ss-10]